MKYALEVRMFGDTVGKFSTDNFEQAKHYYETNYTHYDNCIIVHIDGERISFPDCWKLFEVYKLT